MALNGYWKGVLFSFLGAVVYPLLMALQSQAQSRSIDLSDLGWLAALLFVTFLVGWLAGLLHLPTGELVAANAQQRAPPAEAPVTSAAVAHVESSAQPGAAVAGNP